MKATILLLLACLSAFASAQLITFDSNTQAQCSSASGCSLSSIVSASLITQIIASITTGATFTLDFSSAGSGLNINIDSTGGFAAAKSISVVSLAAGVRNTITVAAGFTVNTANFTVSQSSNAIVNGVVQLQASGNAATTFVVDSSSAVYVSASGSINAAATNIVVSGQANVQGAITTTGSYAQNAGTLVLNSTGYAVGRANATVYAANINIAAGATLTGNGVIGSQSAAGATAVVQVDGTVSIGQSPGVVTVNGDWRPSKTSTFQLEIASQSNFDKLFVTGKAYFAGFVRVTLINGYAPPNGQRFYFVTASGGTDGSFSGITGTDTGSAFKWTSSIDANNGIANYNSAISVAISGLVLVACVLASLL